MSITLKQHRLSAEYPAMTDEDFALLVENIQQKGQQEFIILHEGKILDGWHRYQACTKLGIDPKTSPYRGKDADAFVESKNFHRRHLTASQRALIVAQNEARRQVANISHSPMTNSELAEKSGTSHQTIKDAKKVVEDGGVALKEAVRDNEISISKAAEIADLPKSEQREAVQEEKEKPPVTRKKKTQKKEKPEPEDSNLVDELQRADKEIRSLQAVVESLKKDDLAKEVAKWHQKYDQLEGRLAQAVTTKNEAEKQAKYATGLLTQIRKALKVDKNAQILEAIRQ